MTETYEPINTQTLGSAVASVTFSSIPATYTDLVVIANHDVSANGRTNVQFNGDTASNYSDTFVWGQGTVAQSLRDSNQTGAFAFYATAASGFATAIIQVMNYSNTTTYKTFISRASDAAVETLALVGLWRSTSAITSMTFLRLSGNFDIGTTFTLYGIKAE